tara:strand:- start:222 stop:659 length:438 start_codon:yes stop_codon:yes gene_type:complete
MRLIVNNKQYKHIVSHQNKKNKFVSGWGNYIKDIIIEKLENRNLNENIITINKLNLKLNNKKFFNELPINNVILNIYEENENPFNVEWDKESIYLDKNKQIKDVNLNILINKNNELNEIINENKINLKLLKIKDWYENNIDRKTI